MRLKMPRKEITVKRTVIDHEINLLYLTYLL